MILRETKKGQNIGKKFWGCTKFPQCRGIVNVT
jgi:restriction system protein